jgi:hypothetical protein
MDDVEYISELFIGMVAGPQNKKDTLEDYYIDYDKVMPEEAAWGDQFRAAREMIIGALSADDIRAWSGKSDFYSLFLAFGNLAKNNVKLTKAQRTDVRDALMDFRKKVDQAKKKGAKPATGDVGAYAEAVTRAATDLARRETRLEILERLIEEQL